MSDAELLLFRHSIAEDHHEGGDRLRRLTREGEASMDSAARTLAAVGFGWDFAVMSPYVRARQTHAVVARAFGNPTEASELESLIPAADPRETAANLLELARRHGRVAAFGHNPTLTSAASHLLGGDGKAAYLNIAPGDLAHFRVVSGFGVETILLGFYPRKIMAALAGRSS